MRGRNSNGFARADFKETARRLKPRYFAVKLPVQPPSLARAAPYGKANRPQPSAKVIEDGVRDPRRPAE
jgi:hypothetical protein